MIFLSQGKMVTVRGFVGLSLEYLQTHVCHQFKAIKTSGCYIETLVSMEEYVIFFFFFE